MGPPVGGSLIGLKIYLYDNSRGRSRRNNIENLLVDLDGGLQGGGSRVG